MPSLFAIQCSGCHDRRGAGGPLNPKPAKRGRIPIPGSLCQETACLDSVEGSVLRNSAP